MGNLKSKDEKTDLHQMSKKIGGTTTTRKDIYVKDSIFNVEKMIIAHVTQA